MKSCYQLLLILCFLAGSTYTSSAQETFIKLTDASGKVVAGNSVTRGYEKQIIVTAFSAGKAKDPATQFTMSVQPASGVLQGLQQNGTKLSTALVTFTQKGEQGIIVIYTIRMEEIEISSCANVNDSNGNNTLVELRPARMGTTYYSFNRKSGVNTVSSKTGYDYTNGKPWTKF